MRSGPYSLLVVALAAVLVVMPASFFIWPSDVGAETFTGEVTGLSSYNQPKLDIKIDEIYDRGIGLGAQFTIQTDDMKFEDATLVAGYAGIFMYDIFVNIETDGYISIGCQGELIVLDEGTEVTLTHSGTSERYRNTPLYNNGSTNKRADYSSDEVFANFYEVTGGYLKGGVLYRSFSPLNDPAKQARSQYVNQLADDAGIEYLIALSYTDATVAAAVASLDGYCLTLCEEGKYIAPDMRYLYFQQPEKTKAVLLSMIDNDGPYLIHCNVGRDRTGFVILLLQALCHCTADEMKECETRAFCNLYHVENGSKEYQTIVSCTYDRNMYLIAHPDQVSHIFEVDWNNIDVRSVDTYSAAYNYCTDGLGLTAEQVAALQAKLCA